MSRKTVTVRAEATSRGQAVLVCGTHDVDVARRRATAVRWPALHGDADLTEPRLEWRRSSPGASDSGRAAELRPCDATTPRAIPVTVFDPPSGVPSCS